MLKLTGSIFFLCIVSCDTGEIVDIRTYQKDGSSVNSSGLQGDKIELSWDSPKDSNIQSYTLYVGSKNAENSEYKKMKSVNIDLEEEFDRENPLTEIPLTSLSDYRSLGEVCVVISASNEEGESPYSERACHKF